MSKNINKTLLITLEENVVAALAKYAPDVNVPIGGKSIASKDLQTQLQAHVDTMKATGDARAKYSQLVLQGRAQAAATAPLLSGIHTFVAASYGEQSPEFAAFGFTPRTARHAPSAESRAGAVQKLLATRAARHTMGDRQRAAIHGVVPTTTPPNGPVASPPTTTPITPSVQPAPVASPPATTAPVAPPASPPVTPVANGAAAATTAVNGTSH